jgi:hypothetical protein
MISYPNDLKLFEGIEVKDNKTVVNIFDFDGTLFDSPTPDPRRKKYKVGILKNPYNQNGYGWFQNEVSLSKEYAKVDRFNESIVELARKSMDNPDHITVMLTGRAKHHGDNIKDLLSEKGLVFDEYGLKNATADSTDKFKLTFIQDLIKHYNPAKIEMWEDMEKHAIVFRDFLKSLTNIEGKVNKVSFPKKYLDPRSEDTLVKVLKSHPDFNLLPPKDKKKNASVSYYGAMLTDASREKLLYSISSKIPEGWKDYAHHMTIARGGPKKEEVQKFMPNMGFPDKIFTMTAVAIGINDKALAVKVETDIPSDNDVKHVTVATSPDGKPQHSRDITEWTPLSIPISLDSKLTKVMNQESKK